VVNSQLLRRLRTPPTSRNAPRPDDSTISALRGGRLLTQVARRPFSSTQSECPSQDRTWDGRNRGEFPARRQVTAGARQRGTPRPGHPLTRGRCVRVERQFCRAPSRPQPADGGSVRERTSLGASITPRRMCLCPRFIVRLFAVPSWLPAGHRGGRHDPAGREVKRTSALSQRAMSVIIDVPVLKLVAGSARIATTAPLSPLPMIPLCRTPYAPPASGPQPPLNATWAKPADPRPHLSDGVMLLIRPSTYSVSPLGNTHPRASAGKNVTDRDGRQSVWPNVVA
jgi:hypothetical protein